MSELKFYKLCGAGNDFVLFNAQDIDKNLDRNKFSKKICDRHFSVGADGVIFLTQNSSTEFEWDFYNANGTSGEMCGNAARCVAAYAKEVLKIDQEIELSTLAGKISLAWQEDKNYKMHTSAISWITKNKTPYAAIDTGVPHIVIQTESVEPNADLYQKARSLRYPPDFDSKGANVTFVSDLNIKDKTRLSAITYERGVEDFTLACGTGAIAAIAYAKEFMAGQNKVKMPGGELSVEFHLDGKRANLVGPAEVIFSGYLRN